MATSDIADVECATFGDFILKDQNLSELREKAKGFVTMVDNKLASLNFKIGCLRVLDLRDVVLRIQAKKPYDARWGDMSAIEKRKKGCVDGAVFTVRKKNGELAYLSVINSSIRGLLKPGAEVCFEDELSTSDSASAQRYWYALKLAYLHELCHVLLQHGDAGIAVSPVDADKIDGSNANVPAILGMCDTIMRLYAKVRRQQDFDCDLLALVLAFWPSKRFTKLAMSMLLNWNNDGVGIRESLSRAFQMPVNAVVQWLCIIFGKKLGIHYVRREESTKKWIDCLDPDGTLTNFYTNQYSKSDLFSYPETAASKSASRMRDCKNPLAEREMFFCEALYECNSAAIKKRSDEIIVVGFNKLKVQEELAIFSAGAQQN